MKNKKKFYESKTFWINLFVILVGLFGSSLGLELKPEATISAIGAINVILRFVTKSGISF